MDALDAMSERYEALRRSATTDQLPAAWIKRAKSITGDTVDYLSLFDGTTGAINLVGQKFSLVGLPPVDVANTTAPLDL